MKIIPLATAVAALASAGCFATFAYAKTIPCEDKLVELRAAMQTARPNEVDAHAVKDLEARGVERCNADDDKRADAFFDDAIKILKR